MQSIAGHVVKSQDDILGRHDDRLAVRRRKNIIRRHHQCAGFDLRLDGQWHVHRHLVAVKVGIVSRANQRVKLDRFALD